MILLALNKQLDLQSWLTQTGKELARAQGWYRHRQTVQLAFIRLALTAIGLPALLQRRFWRLDTTSAAHRAGTIR